MKKKNTNNVILFIFGIAGCIVLINLIALSSFFRIDLTKDKKYTLSLASKEALNNLSDTVTITAYFTESLPPPYAQNARYVQDLLEEYVSSSNAKLAFEFLDPAKEETLEDKEKKKNSQKNIFGQVIREATSIENELSSLGLQPVEIRVIEDDQQQTKRAYMGIVIRYHEKHEVIPVVQDTSGLEMSITTLIRKLTKVKKTKIGLVKNDSYVGNLENFINLISKDNEVKSINLLKEDIDKDIDALLVIGSGDHFGVDGSFKIDNYLREGKSAAFFIDRFNVEPRNFVAVGEKVGSSTYSILDILTKYGIEINANLVADAACASLNMQEERSGFAFTIPVKYPFIPEVRNLSFDSSITKGISGLIFPFAPSLTITEKANLKVTVLASTSKVSWLEKEPLNLNPKRNWSEVDISPDGPYKILVQAIGKLPNLANDKESSDKDSRIVVAGTSSFLWNEFATEANQAIALNIVDWMIADVSLLQMRARSFVEVPLNVDINDNVRQTVKFLNILGVPFLLIIFGLIRWRIRENNRKMLKA